MCIFIEKIHEKEKQKYEENGTEYIQFTYRKMPLHKEVNLNLCAEDALLIIFVFFRPISSTSPNFWKNSSFEGKKWNH